MKGPELYSIGRNGDGSWTLRSPAGLRLADAHTGRAALVIARLEYRQTGVTVALKTMLDLEAGDLILLHPRLGPIEVAAVTEVSENGYAAAFTDAAGTTYRMAGPRALRVIRPTPVVGGFEI